ncbi:AcrR family transcriptional regulator [Microbacterium terrae]|uniref:TetR/AcrR family transcriptional regulator n=1 Tax=Microbacterium terrae TaxID=69369 RepID=UPI0014706F06|nr:TetR family transcriptional regulator [Microbacterium terrae]MBP1078668.1 AcrR family transcriptional regulator [Microbacterium terrae]GLJ98069.1 TetR family transcriptional regulator [Microbacterium terrae]
MSIDKGGKTGRRPGRGSTRDSIVLAARAQFAANGFEGATLRAIAADAGVDPALIRHFFGDKEGLFAATLILPTDRVRALIEAFEGGPTGIGERVTRHYLGLWDAEGSRETLTALARTAIGHDKAMDRFRDFLMSTVGREAAALVDQDRPQLRLNLAMAQLLGIALARYVVRTPPIVQASFEEVVAAVAPTVDHYLVGGLGPSRSVS